MGFTKQHCIKFVSKKMSRNKYELSSLHIQSEGQGFVRSMNVTSYSTDVPSLFLVLFLIILLAYSETM